MKLFTDQAVTPNNKSPDAQKMAAYSMVRRKLEVRSGLGRRTDTITAATHGVDQLRSSSVDLPPQAADMALDQTGARIEVEAPDMLQQHRAGYNLIRVFHQVFQQFVFPRLQIDQLTAPPDRPSQQVHLQVGHPQHGLGRGAKRPSAKRGDTRDQFGEGKRLDQIIIAAGIKAADPVVQSAHGGQKKRW